MSRPIYPDLPRPRPSPPRTPPPDRDAQLKLLNPNSQYAQQLDTIQFDAHERKIAFKKAHKSAKNHEQYEKRKAQARSAAEQRTELESLIRQAALLTKPHAAPLVTLSEPAEPQPLDEKTLAARASARERKRKSRARMKIIKKVIAENPQLTDVINNDMPRCSVCNSNSRVIMFPDTDFADFYCTRCEFYW